MIISRTPLRISLVGGGSDLPAFYERDPEVHGNVVSFAIDKYVYVVLNKKFDASFRISYSRTENISTVEKIEHDLIRESIKLVRRAGNGLEIVTIADIPGDGSGLGSSSSLAVGMITVLNAYIHGPLIHKSAFAESAFTVEAVKCGHPVGKQDHYAAAYGGFNRFEFKKGDIGVMEVKSNWDSEYPWSLDEINQCFLLLWTGKRKSGTSRRILSEQGKSMEDEKNYQRVKQMSLLAHRFFIDFTESQSNPLTTLGIYLRQNWELKKQLHPSISDEQIDFWYDLGMNNGALGGKLCGAGGGGFLLFVAPPEEHKRIVKATGLRQVPFRIANQGSEVIYNDQI